MKDVIELAKQAGFISDFGCREAASDELLKRFAALVRNAALDEAESLITRLDNTFVNLQPHEAVTAINALKEPTL